MKGRQTLFAPERQELVLPRLSETGRVDAAALAGELGVSNESVRKDLALLEERGMAALLPAAHSALFVCTNSLPIASALTDASGVTAQLLGGTVRKQSRAGVGPLTVTALAAVTVDVAFLGANAISATRGLTTPDEKEGMTKKAKFSAARHRILLADHSKFDRESLHRYADLADLDTLITDGGISDQAVEAFTCAGVEVTIARKAA